MKSLYRKILASTGLFLLLGCQPVPPKNPEVPSVSSSSAASSISSSSVPAAISRRPCVPSDFEFGGEEWGRSWNADASVTTVHFESPKRGLSFDIPYNPAWGNKNCQLAPYDETENGMAFGFAGIFEGGGATRFSRMDFLPPRSAKEALAAAKETQRPDEQQGLIQEKARPVIVTINGNAAVQYSLGGFCDQTYFEVVGKKFNYLFESTCNVELTDILPALKSLRIQ